MKSKVVRALLAGAVVLAAAPQAVMAADPPAATAEQQQAAMEAKFKAMERELHPQSGHVAIRAAKASLELGDRYYFLPAEEAKRVLTEGWGNPPDAVDGVLGMVFPAGKSFRDRTWGAVIQYEESGHVSDKDAASEDYDSVLADMKSAEEEENKALQEQGYPGSHIVGWAQAPAYDARTKTLIWARNIKFDDVDGNTLNYDVRTLGRTGVLSLNMVDSMANLASVQDAARDLGATVKFDTGARYADFNPSSDKVADYGLAGLVAAGVGVAVAKKLGFLGIILLFAKKGLVFIVAGFAAIGAWFKRRFRRGESDESFEEPIADAPPAE